MRWSCIAPSSSALACALLAASPALADDRARAMELLGIAPPDPVLHYAMSGREVAIMPRDVMAIEISESGGITDLFVRLAPEATDAMTALTQAAVGLPMVVRVCGTTMLEALVQAPVDSGTIYIPGTNALRAEAMRALWHGRARCDTLGPEVFEHGQ